MSATQCASGWGLMVIEFVKHGLPWILSGLTIYMSILAGNKTRWAWLIGIANQALWLVFIVGTGTWGLLPMNIALWVVYGRNHLKWRDV